MILFLWLPIVEFSYLSSKSISKLSLDGAIETVLLPSSNLISLLILIIFIGELLISNPEEIKKNGLAKGGSLENAIVVKDDNILNNGGLRNSKEFVNHKILDCIGDLYTCGYRMIANVVCSQGGHFLTNKLLRKTFENKDNFSIVEIKERNLPHTVINRNLLRSIA